VTEGESFHYIQYQWAPLWLRIFNFCFLLFGPNVAIFLPPRTCPISISQLSRWERQRKTAAIDKRSSHSISLTIFGRLYFEVSKQCTCKDIKWVQRLDQSQNGSDAGGLGQEPSVGLRLGLGVLGPSGKGDGAVTTGAGTTTGRSALPQALIRSIIPT
jgi:hypothetical protein